MRVALFVPCYVDQLRPEVGLAALDVLEACGIEADFPEGQTCCGQPFLTAGETARARALAGRFIDVFEGFDTIVSLSGSCAATVARQFPLLAPGSRGDEVAGRTREFCDFLADHALAGDGEPDTPWGAFPHRVGLHSSCHALRELGLGTPSESRAPARPDPARRLLESVADLELVALERSDECCGFGGIFALEEEAVSCRMGLDRLEDHRRARAELIASTDISCLLHLAGVAEKNAFDFRTLHVAEVLAAALPERDAREAHGVSDGPR